MCLAGLPKLFPKVQLQIVFQNFLTKKNKVDPNISWRSINLNFNSKKISSSHGKHLIWETLALLFSLFLYLGKFCFCVLLFLRCFVIKNKLPSLSQVRNDPTQKWIIVNCKETSNNCLTFFSAASAGERNVTN